jgi:RNase P subunit RPR2
LSSTDENAERGICPACRTAIWPPRKKWIVAGRPDRAGNKIQMEFALFECPKCCRTFRVIIRKTLVDQTGKAIDEQKTE